MKTIQELQKELDDAIKAESTATNEIKQKEQQALLDKRNSLLESAQNLRVMAIREAENQELGDSQKYEKLAQKAEQEARAIVLDGEEVICQATINEENLEEFRQESKTANGFWFVGISVLMAFLYWRFGVAIQEAIPEAGTHSLTTIIKAFSVLMFMFIIELFLMGLGSIKDNYLHRYADAKQHLTIDIIKDFYNASPNTRLWLRFAYFALRFYACVQLATGNLV